MAIEIRPTGESRAYAASGFAVGQAQLAKEIRAREHAISMAKFQAEAAAKAREESFTFDLAKTNIRVQNDFMKSEQIRMDRSQVVEDRRQFEEDQKLMAETKKKQEYDLRIKSIDETDILSDSEKDRAKLNQYNKFHGGSAKLVSIQQEAEERAQGRYAMAQERHTVGKPSSFAQKKSAQEFLEEKKRGPIKQALGWDAYSEKDQLLAEEAQAVLRNQPTATPGGKIPTVTSQEQYDALPRGAKYYGSKGQILTKG